MIAQIDTATGSFRRFRNGFSRPGAALSQSARAAGYAGRGYKDLENTSELVVRVVSPTLDDDEVLEALTVDDGRAGQRDGDIWVVNQRKRNLGTEEVAVGIRERRASLALEVDRELAQRQSDGFLHSDGHIYQIDSRSQSRMISALVLFSQGVSGAHRGYWRDAANVDRVMTDDDATTLFRAALSYGAALVASAHAHKRSISLLDSTTDMEAYDVSADWP